MTTDLPMIVAAAAAVMLLAKWAAQLWLEHLNRRHVRARNGLPPSFNGVMDEATFKKSVRYTLAKSGFAVISITFHTLVVFLVLFSGLLPWAHRLFTEHLGVSAWSMAGYLFAVGFLLTLISLPLDWHEQFRLEERFGFNTSSVRLWWTDWLKGFCISLAIGYPLLVLILKCVEWAGAMWWLWAWLCVVGFQIVMVVVTPMLILPLFNKFSPLPEGSLRDRLMRLAERLKFPVSNIQVMDGSKRSRHSNAFFTGFGRFRKIILFDTLAEQLDEEELESVVAHEIGHYKLKHVPKMLLFSTASLLLAFWVIATLAGQEWFYAAFGFPPGHIAPALLLFGLLSGAVTFWFSPVANHWSRRHEYQADAFAAEAIGEPQPLISALRKLSEKNLANLTPHPVYSRFYYSHPTLLERESALTKAR